MENIIMRNNTKHSAKAFTLLELIVVLGIMGFIIAMVAPRLAGLIGGAVDTVCDTNQNRLRGFISTSVNQTGRLPNKLVSVVRVVSHTAVAGIGNADTWGAVDAVTTASGFVSDEDPANGAEVLAAEFAVRNHFGIHYLNADEAKELRQMGITKALVLEVKDGDGDGTADDPEAYREVDVKIGLPVLMVGGASANAAADVTAVDVVAGQEFGAPGTIYKMIFGISQDSTLTKDGIIENAPNCPGGIQNADNCTFNWYTIIAPRLEATIARLAAAAPTSVDATGIETGQKKTFALDEAEEVFQYSTQCPEGHKWPEPEEDNWTID